MGFFLGAFLNQPEDIKNKRVEEIKERQCKEDKSCRHKASVHSVNYVYIFGYGGVVHV